MPQTAMPVTEPMPANTTYGTITANLSSFMASKGADSGSLPERDVASGTVTFQPLTPNGYVIDTSTGDVIYCTPETVHIRADGTIKVTLVATDNADLMPTGWQYQVSVRLDGGLPPISFKVDVPGGVTSTLGQLLIASNSALTSSSAGTAVNAGVGAPSAATNGTFYIDTATGNLWQKK